MKRLLFTLAFASILLYGCQNQEQLEETESPNEVGNNDLNGNGELNDGENDESDKEENAEVEELETISVYDLEENEGNYFSVEELAEVTDGSFEYDTVDKSLYLEIEGREFYLVYGVPVLEVNGLYTASDEVILVEYEEEPFVSVEFIKHGLEVEYSHEEEDELVSFVWEDVAVDAWSSSGQEELDIESFSVEDMVEFLSFLNEPIESASVSTVESHLPGAPRDYRNGFHEGIDWYDYSTGTDITTDTPINAMAEGVVVRVDDDFEDYPSHEMRNEDLDLAAEVGFTPEYILDRLRGQQVWVQYDNGIMNRFAHLDSIPEDLELGQEVDEETIIGYVGNTGTSGALNQDGSGLHLHQDLLIYGELFWEPFSLEETQEILNQLWP